MWLCVPVEVARDLGIHVVPLEPLPGLEESPEGTEQVGEVLPSAIALVPRAEALEMGKTLERFVVFVDIDGPERPPREETPVLIRCPAGSAGSRSFDHDLRHVRTHLLAPFVSDGVLVGYESGRRSRIRTERKTLI
jgi:hypothetical protein